MTSAYQTSSSEPDEEAIETMQEIQSEGLDAAKN